jgi:hypothetical protein
VIVVLSTDAKPARFMAAIFRYHPGLLPTLGGSVVLGLAFAVVKRQTV